MADILATKEDPYNKQDAAEAGYVLPEPPVDKSKENLNRSLSSRQISMIAIVS
jgi:amino acid permease